jgi:hypothetical protein
VALITRIWLFFCTGSLSFANEYSLLFRFVRFYAGKALELALCIISLTGTFKIVCPSVVNIFKFCNDIVRIGGGVKTNLEDRTHCDF